MGGAAGIRIAGAATASPWKPEGTWMNDWKGSMATGPGVLQIKYIWTSTGSADVTDDCANSLTVTVQISDYAPSGTPSVVRGAPSTGSDDASTGGKYVAYADGQVSVLYYDPINLYQRGTSLVEVKVSASYMNKSTKTMLPLGCKVTYTSVTPTPTAPILGTTTSPVDCG
jgi:hypothetical protein